MPSNRYAAMRLLPMMLALIVILAGCREGNSAPPPSPELSPTPMASGGPSIKEARSMTVKDAASGSTIEVNRTAAVEALLAGLRQASPVGIGDPEPQGRLYELALRSDGDDVVRTFRVNDLTETDSLRESVVVYERRDDGGEVAWQLPSAWLRELLAASGDPAAEAPPLLRLSVAEASGSVIVLANRDVDRGSVDVAVAKTLRFSLPGSAATADGTERTSRYEVYWSDPQRFVVRFADLADGEAARFRLDGVRSVAGESFASEDQPNRNEAIVYSRSYSPGLRWIDPAERQTTRARALDRIVMLQPTIWGAAGEGVLAYDRDGGVRFVRLADGAASEPAAIAGWPDAGEPFGNDYGTDVLFADRVTDDWTYAAKGNRTLYRVNVRTGEARKLYDSKRPIYGVAAAPDGGRAALLVASDDFVGPNADLMVLDAKGRELYSRKRAAFVSHSDGFLFAYPMEWRSPTTLLLPMIGLDGIERGRVIFDAAKQTLSEPAETKLTEADRAALLAAEGLPPSAGATGLEIVRIVPDRSPLSEARYVAVQESAGGSWLIDRQSGEVDWLGTGTPIGWTNAGQLVAWEAKRDERIQLLGMDGG